MRDGVPFITVAAIDAGRTTLRGGERVNVLSGELVVERRHLPLWEGALSESFPVAAWFQLIGFAALIGAGGQGARTVVGIKKLNDAASVQAASGVQMGDLLVASKLIVSLLIGAIAAGIVAATTMSPGAGLTGEQIAGLAAAGYAGADFIEGFITRASPAPGAAPGTEAVGTGGAADRIADADDAVG